MKLIISSFAIVIIFSLISCEDNSAPSSSYPKLYHYNGYDSLWNTIVTGVLWIDSIDSINVKGRWRFKLVGDGKNIGPQTGFGSFDGTTDMRGSLSLNLHPGMIDNNVLLDCSMQLPYRIDGQWSYVGFPGVINWGRFEAEQIR